MEDSTRREFLEGALASTASPPSRKDFEPAYLRLERSGELAKRASELYAIYRRCRLCPRQCGVDRTKGERGICSSGSRAKVYSAHPHFGEERPLVGRSGSGTIFFSNCNLLCVFCQNWQINHRGDGSDASEDFIGRCMTDLHGAGCHNINLVTPTHVLPNIIGGLRIAIRRGLRVPLVYNCGGYEEVPTLRLLEGIFGIYMPDFKYGDSEVARRYSGVPRYVETTMEALVEMHRQVGPLTLDGRGIAVRGLLVRHLVLPGGLAGTRRVMEFIARELSPDTYVNIMDQYRPCFKAVDHPPLNRRITTEEFREAVAIAREEGLRRLDGFP